MCLKINSTLIHAEPQTTCSTTLSSWMGVYDFDAADPPTLSIANLSFIGCATNPAVVASSSSNPSNTRFASAAEGPAASQTPDAAKVSHAEAQPSAHSQPSATTRSEIFKTSSSTATQPRNSADGPEAWSSARMLSSSSTASPASLTSSASTLPMEHISSHAMDASSAPVHTMLGDNTSEASRAMPSNASTVCENLDESENAVEVHVHSKNSGAESPHEESQGAEAATASSEEDEHAPDFPDLSSSPESPGAKIQHSGQKFSYKDSKTLTPAFTTKWTAPFVPPEPASSAKDLPSGLLRGNGGAPVASAIKTPTALHKAGQETEHALQPSEEEQEEDKVTSPVQTADGYEYVPDSSSARVAVGTIVLLPILLATVLL